MVTVGSPVITYFEVFINTNFLTAIPAWDFCACAISLSICSIRLFSCIVIPWVRDSYRLQLIQFTLSQILTYLGIFNLKCLQFSESKFSVCI